jgi:hypothetical protein
LNHDQARLAALERKLEELIDKVRELVTYVAILTEQERGRRGL